MRRYAVLALTSVLTWQAAGANELPAGVQAALSRYHLSTDSISIHVSDPARGETLLSHHADRLRNPASLMKLVTSYAALDLLGPNHTWRTGFYSTQPIRSGVLDGDLHLKGGGDPMMLMEDLLRTLFMLRSMGLREIRGDLVVDSSHFDERTIDVRPLDDTPFRAYNAYPGSAVINFRATRFLFLPRAGAIDIIADPPATTLRIDNRLTAEAGPCRGAHRAMIMQVDAAASGTTMRFSGRYPESCGEYELTRTVLRQDAYLFGVFQQLWTTLGGVIDGGLRHGSTPEHATLLYEHLSRPLSEVLRGINKYSNNLMARSLLLTLGGQHNGAAGTVQAGRDAIRAWLTDRELAMNGLVIDNGAGLSRGTRMTARDLAELLEDVLEHPYRDEFLSSLSLAGIDGSTRKRLREDPRSGRYRLKTGLLDGVRAAAGYGLTARGTRLVIVIIQNAPTLNYHQGNSIQDALFAYLHENF